MCKRHYFFLLAAGLLFPSLASAQWVRQRAPRGLFSLTDVHFTDADHGYASAAIGGLMKTVDGGQNWANVTTGVNSSLRDVFFADPDTGYVVGNVGVIIGTRDGGQTWTHYDLPNTGSSVNGVYFRDGHHGFITQGDVIFKTDNGGAHWDTAYVYNGALPIFTFRFLEFPTPLVGYAVGGYSGSFGNVAEIAKTTDGGRSWQLIPSAAGTTPMGAASAVAFPDAQIGYVADVSNRLFRTSDGGQTWRIVSQNTFGAFYGMDFISANEGFGAGYNGNLQHTTDGGFTWHDMSISTAPTYAAVYFPTAAVGYVVGDNGSGTADVIKYDNPTGLPENPAVAGIAVAPNPSADGRFRIDAPAGTTLSITDILGREVYHNSNPEPGAFDLSLSRKGLYILQFETGGRVYQQKLVVE